MNGDKFYPKELLIIKQDQPLNEFDSPTQTFGCRHSNWNICKNAFSANCAFVSKDHICKMPSKKWPIIYAELKNKTK